MLTQIGKYKIVGKLGEGGMGVVYRAYDPLMQRHVAIKTITGELEQVGPMRDRFLREAVAVGRLSHPNIITVHDLLDDDQRTCIVMEYLDGENLQQAILSGRVATLERRIEVVREVCKGLSHAHKVGVIHRDIKPANILVTKEGTVKILDFGIARIATSRSTTTGSTAGTPYYMSPEQWSGGKIDHRTDIFSLGVMLYELLAGRRPFESHNPTVIGYQVVNNDPEAIHEVNPSIPVELSAIVRRTLAKMPDDRFKDVMELHQALEGFEEQLRARADALRGELQALELKLQRLIDDSHELLRGPLLTEFLEVQDWRDEASERLLSRIATESSDLPTKQWVTADYLQLLSERHLLETQHQRVSELLPAIRKAQEKIAAVQRHREEGKLQEALIASQELVSEFPSLPSALSLRRSVEIARTPAAERLSDSKAAELLERAQLLRLEGLFDESQSCLRELLQRDPSHAEALQRERQLIQDRTERVRAEACLERAAESLEQGDWARCLEQLDELDQLEIPLSGAGRLRERAEGLQIERLDAQRRVAAVEVDVLSPSQDPPDSSKPPAEKDATLVRPDANVPGGLAAFKRQWVWVGALLVVGVVVSWLGWLDRPAPLSVDRSSLVPARAPAGTSDDANGEPVSIPSSAPTRAGGEETSENPSSPSRGTPTPTTRKPPKVETRTPRETAREVPPPVEERVAATTREPSPLPERRESVDAEIRKTEPPPDPGAAPPEREPPAPLPAGTVEFQSTPSARLRVNGELLPGTTPLTASLAPGRHRLEWMSAGGGVAWAEDLVVVAGESTSISRRLEIFGSLSIISEGMVWAEASLDGGPKQQIPFFFPKVPVGKHQVQITRPGYKEQRHEVTIEDGSRAVLRLVLERISPE